MYVMDRAYQLSLDAKELAYSQLVGVVKTKTAEGMVPNFWQPQQISYDRTEPAVAAKILHEMFSKYSDKWIVKLLYFDCADWIDWFFRKRREPPHNLIVLGSDPGLPTSDTPNMQAARYESGLDNSPMYDGPDSWFNTSSNHMMLYDVGMTAMVMMELRALANLSISAFDPPRLGDHALHTSRLKELQDLTNTHLWDDERGAYINKLSFNDTFYPRVSPTSFYPLQSKTATDAQANAIVGKWLLNKTRFCITPDGSLKGNDDTCYW